MFSGMATSAIGQKQTVAIEVARNLPLQQESSTERGVPVVINSLLILVRHLASQPFRVGRSLLAL